jgi:hypothetical protein
LPKENVPFAAPTFIAAAEPEPIIHPKQSVQLAGDSQRSGSEKHDGGIVVALGVCSGAANPAHRWFMPIEWNGLHRRLMSFQFRDDSRKNIIGKRRRRLSANCDANGLRIR